MGSTMDLTKEPKILIVGGGMAGISAAKQLIASGMKDVTILEAKERLGGRIHTINHGDKHLEIGAQWIHGEENNPLYEMAAANNMVAGESDSDTDIGSSLNVAFDEPWENQFFTQDGRRVDPEIVRETCLVLDGIFSEADKFHRENKPISDENESMGTFVFDTFYKYLRTTGYAATAEEWRVREALFQWRLQEEAADCGCKSLYEMSAGAWGEFRECQGEDVTLLYGYQALLNLLLADIPVACVRLNAPVQCVYWDQQHPQPPHAITTEDVSVIPTAAERKSRDYPVALRTKSGELLPADHVIFTSSLGVLKKSAHYLFKPILPRDKMAAIHRLGFGTVDKVYLEWEKPWWSKDMHAVQLAWMPDEPFVLDRQEGGARSGGNDEWYRGLHAFERVDYQPHLLLGWVAGAEAEVMETLPEADVLDVCHQVLVKFTGKHDMPKPVRLIRSKWGHDAYTSGSYSYIRVGSTGQDMDLLAQPLPSTQCPHLLFAGEATHPQYFSTVHGALESGQREARRLLQYYNNSTK